MLKFDVCQFTPIAHVTRAIESDVVMVRKPGGADPGSECDKIAVFLES